MLTLYAVTVTVVAITCAVGWLCTRHALREERGWSAHYLDALMRRDLKQRRGTQTAIEQIDAVAREAWR